MTSATPWSVKGIDPKAREVAKDLARRSGMTLGEWLNRMILEDEEPEEVASESYFTERPSQTYFETPRPQPEPVVPSRVEAPEHPADEIGRVALALDRLTDRIEQSEARAGMAIKGVEFSVREAVARISAAEREHIAVAARFEGAVDETRTEQQRIADRLRRMESEAAGPRSAEALRALESALGKVATHLYEGESRTRSTISEVISRVEAVEGREPVGGNFIDEVVSRVGNRLEEAEARTNEALDGLRDGFVALEGRLRSVEGGSSPAIDQRLEALAANLTNRVEASRAEIAQKLQASAEGRFDRMERKLSEMSDHVRVAEQRSAHAIEKMGREVLSMADNLNRRVQATENRSADAIEQVGGEVARIAQAMEQKLSRTDVVQAEALERLGTEIGRITERLAERIAASERRSAQAIDDVGEQVARVTERMNQRSERASDDLAERIRQSEERTARLLEEAREKIDQRLGETQRRLSEEVASVPAATARVAAPRIEQTLSPFGADPFPSFGPSEAEPMTDDGFEPQEPQGPTSQASFAASFPAEVERPGFDAEDFEAADGFAPIQGAAHEDIDEIEVGLDAPDVTPSLALEPGRPLSTREVIEQARAAARAAAQAGDGKKGKARPEKAAKAPKAPREPGKSLFAGLTQKSKATAGSSLQTALLVTGGLAFLGVSSTGLVMMAGEPGGAPPKRVAEALSAFKSGKSGEIQAPEADTTPFGPAPRMAVALSPTPLNPAAPVATTQDLPALYREAVRKVEAKETGGLDDLKKAAGLGYTPAQFYLSKLYENGEGGVKKDPVEARRWTERAAQGGESRAMHNLAIAYFYGNGGTKNSTTASQWFKRAADLGLVDSQYNLGRLYEGGIGVSQNGAEAYKWYLIAGRSGDQESRDSANRVKADLSAEARAVAERAAKAFRSAQPNPSASANTVVAGTAAPQASLTNAQKALSRLGYYRGPMDGAASPALTLAVAAYQRDQGMPANGALDPVTQSRLSVFTR